MKELIWILTIVALTIPSYAYNETELDLFASGVVAATDPDARWDVNNGMIAVIRPATDLEINDLNFAYSSIRELSVAADAIARRFPGEFNSSSGGLRIGPTPYVAITIFYPARQPA